PAAAEEAFDGAETEVLCADRPCHTHVTACSRHWLAAAAAPAVVPVLPTLLAMPRSLRMSAIPPPLLTLLKPAATSLSSAWPARLPLRQYSTSSASLPKRAASASASSSASGR